MHFKIPFTHNGMAQKEKHLSVYLFFPNVFLLKKKKNGNPEFMRTIQSLRTLHTASIQFYSNMIEIVEFPFSPYQQFESMR